MQQAIAVTLISLFSALLLFQLLLALGAPLGKAAWGGTQEVLPTNLRIASLISVIIFGFAILVVLDRLEIASFISDSWLSTGILFVFAGLFALSTLANLMSSSPWERFLMSPLAFAMSLLSLGLALMSHNPN